jgi:hypothetical protein
MSNTVETLSKSFTASTDTATGARETPPLPPEWNDPPHVKEAYKDHLATQGSLPSTKPGAFVRRR